MSIQLQKCEIFDSRQSLCNKKSNFNTKPRRKAERENKSTRISNIRNETVLADLCINTIVFSSHSCTACIRTDTQKWAKLNNCNRFSLLKRAHAVVVVLCDVRYLSVSLSILIVTSSILMWANHFDYYTFAVSIVSTTPCRAKPNHVMQPKNNRTLHFCCLCCHTVVIWHTHKR